DALFDISDEETVRLRAWRAAERGEDEVLGAVDVLVFVHEDEFDAPLPLARERRRGVGVVVPEEFDGELLEVGEIDDGGGAAGGGELVCELIEEVEHGEGVVPRPLPILLERVDSRVRVGEVFAELLRLRGELVELVDLGRPDLGDLAEARAEIGGLPCGESLEWGRAPRGPSVRRVPLDEEADVVVPRYRP